MGAGRGRRQHSKSVPRPNTRKPPALSFFHVSPAFLCLPSSSLFRSIPRPPSASDALDPYYFGCHSTSPRPPIPRTPPTSIDRRALVGVGELTTPRWASHKGNDHFHFVVPAGPDPDDPDSPWTIEAVDAELSEHEEPVAPVRILRSMSSMAEESGGEEILYPRHLPDLPPMPGVAQVTRPPDEPAQPPSSYSSSPRRTKKRSSEEFEIDQFGMLISKSSKDDDKTLGRKHRSLNLSISTSIARNRERKRSSAGLSPMASAKASNVSPRSADRHARQVSAAINDHHHSRRGFSNDLPPAQSTAPGAIAKSTSQSHSAVAHSVLRGPQEGWSELDDEATVEALRKLDGLSGKTARARASFGSLGRHSSSSRPPTPAGKTSAQWEGVNSVDPSRVKRGTKDSSNAKDKDRDSIRLVGSAGQKFIVSDHYANVTSSDDQHPNFEKTPKKIVSATTRSSFTPKRGSTSSTNYTSTPTTSSRDSASVSISTSLTSVSANSGRYSTGKGRRDSAGSDSMHFSETASIKERNASSISNGDPGDDAAVPPVPPLPKDLSNYRSPQPAIPSQVTQDDAIILAGFDSKEGHQGALDAPTLKNSSTIISPPPRRHSQFPPSTATNIQSAPESSPPVPKTPSKKWSFSALNIKLTSPASTSKTTFPLSPKSAFGSRPKSSSRDQSGHSPGQRGPWSPEQPGAMDSEGSLASLSSVGSVQNPIFQMHPSKTPDAIVVPSRSSTGSSASTNVATSALAAPQPSPLTPASPVHRSQSKRLTPSSIPFFRRSSSQSMQVPPSFHVSTSPTFSSGAQTPSVRKANSSPSRDQTSLSTPGSTQKKSSVLSLGFPSLLKSSSRRSLHSDSKDSAKEQKVKDGERKKEKDKLKKDEKDRSESRISLLMSGGRKRGKTLSSAEPRKPKSPVSLPPMQVPALEQATAQRLARFKSGTSTAAATPMISRSISSSRVMAQTASSMQKQSDTSLRSRNHLPTIAGSPSVGATGTNGSQTLKDQSLPYAASSLTKETPTKIPRISSRTSTAASPTPKSSSSSMAHHRISVHTSGPSVSTNPSPTLSANEFGVMEDGPVPKSVLKQPLRSSPPGSSRLPRQASISLSNNLSGKKNRDSSHSGVRKPSTSSIASLSTPAALSESASRHFTAFSPSKGLKLLSPKISLSSARGSNTMAVSNTRQGSPSSTYQTPSTPSPAPSSIDEDELIGDEEMLQYIKRQHAKKLSAGATQEELDKLLQFPEPLPPGTPSSPTVILHSRVVNRLSDYERKEILDYPSVYYIGDNSQKNQAMLDSPSNNHGYDDDRGDYLVVHRDHLAYRYEVVDTLGKGSFGQVLHCRDHCTGESVAIKIIRNKKRFHHQALVEIRILDKLRTWDADEKHHVIKMTEHFYFRNHLCIAMELLSINLYELIKANGFVGFTTALIRRFTSQMLMSLSLMRQYRIVHCDLKPENVLLRHPSKSAIKVIDFGSSCFENEKIYTYIQSRFYRSPEVILGMNYHMAIDMWSLGCILAELYTGFPIFPGENEQEQLSCIMEVLGVPDKEFVNRSSRKKLFFEANGGPRVVVNSKGRRRRPGSKTLQQVLKCNDDDFVDFIAKCLVWDPERRMKPQAALRHPFVTAGRKNKITTTIPSSSRSTTASISSLNNSRSKPVIETPKKSMISAPTPLTARSSRTTIGGPTTPNSTSHMSALGSSRSFRTSSHSLYHSGRTLSGVTTTATSK
ncbi:hypothetical protein APHAL10511_001362 [Amanita phalloides]|nr:hypothetical protein APHAL10511_001362 [Amanita phalloides]